MASINYIQQYYNLQTTTANYNRLYIAVRSSIYQQCYNAILPSCDGRQKKHVAEKVTNLYFFIHFNCIVKTTSELSRTSDLSMDLLCNAIACRNHDQFIKYRDILKNLNLIEYNSNYSPERKTNKEITSYTVNIFSRGLDCSSKRYIMIEFNIPNYSMKYYTNLCSKVHKYTLNLPSNTNLLPSHNIYGTSSNETFNVPISYTPRCTTSKVFSKELFLDRYTRLDYEGNPSPMDRDYQAIINMKATKTPARMAEDGRIYHSFHSIEHEHRKNILYDGEHIVESFDVHSCNFCLLWSVLDDTVSEMEKNSFYNLVISGKFYESVMDYANKNDKGIGRHWDRDWTKEQCVAYLNTRQKTIAEGRMAIEKNELTYVTKDSRYEFQIDGYYRAWVDKYFEEFYPGIREFINHVKDNDSRKGALHYLLAPVETKVITFGVIKELYEKYGIEALSLHDGVYVKESDAKFMKDNNISTEVMFKEYLMISKL